MLALKHKVHQLKLKGGRGLRWSYKGALEESLREIESVRQEAENFAGQVGAENVVSVIEHCFCGGRGESGRSYPYFFAVTTWYREQVGAKPVTSEAFDERSRRKAAFPLALKRMVYEFYLGRNKLHWSLDGYIAEITQKMDDVRQDAEEFARQIGAENLVSIVEHSFPSQTAIPIFFTVTVWYRDKFGAKPAKDPAVDEYFAGG